MPQAPDFGGLYQKRIRQVGRNLLLSETDAKGQLVFRLYDVLTGKDTGKDESKVTFVRLLGVPGAQALAAELLGFAVDSLAPLGRKADPLRELAVFVQHRSR